MKDFFISYNKADRSWAEWIAWTLEESGYSVVIQAWDFRPGGNFVLDMTRAAEDTRKTIAVISEDYLNAAFTQSEWAAAFARDPLSQERKLVPVRVRECKPEGILSQIVYIDIVGLTENQARSALLEALVSDRAKPDTPPYFPGDVQHSKPIKPEFPRRMDEIRLFFSYSHSDEKIRDELAKHLSLLKRQNIIIDWHDRKILPGTEWEYEIDKYLNSSQIILLLISADFLASEYCYSKEMERAIERHETGEARVIPIILRACDWQSAPFGKLQALPRDGKPVTSWTNQDEAFTSIAQGISLACRDLRGTLHSQVPEDYSKPIAQSIPSIIYNSIDVFKYPGVPDVTFVEPDKFYLLKNSLRQPGLGVVIEGPSGIGKTTALRKAVDQLKTSGQLGEIEIISARRSEDVRRIKYIEQWHRGVLAVDDFHRLDEALRTHVADYLKYLADRESPAKLVIVGIPGTEKRLIEIAFDLGTRIRSFKLGKVSDEIVLSMIDKGEKALNITLDRKSEIALASGGSLNIAQILCSNLVAQSGIDKTQSVIKSVHCDIETAISEVMDQLIPKFADVIRCFTTGHFYKSL